MQWDLNLIWYVLVGILLTGYAILDGFDFGVGAWHLFTRKEEERRILLNAIGPVWDGNEVWLVTGGGALFAAFPDVYATVFSGFYLPFILLLFSLIFRAVAIEFRGKEPMAWWRRVWDTSFSVASIVASLLIGVAFGNIAWGIPIGADKEFQGNFFSLIHPYSVLVGLFVLMLFMMHGALYIVLKAEGDFRERAKRWAKRTNAFVIGLYVLTTVLTLATAPHMIEPFRRYPVLFLIPVLAIAAMVHVPHAVSQNRDGRAFLSSCLAIIFLMMLFGIGMFPNLVYSNPLAQNSLTIYNAASSQKTLSIMLVIALIGMPLVIAYTVSIYWIFRGKVKLDTESY